MTIEEAREQLRSLQEKMAAYEHAMGLLYYDGATTAPKGTAENRGRSQSILSGESYRLATGPELKETVSFLSEHPEALTAAEKRQIAILEKDWKRMEKIPIDEYMAYSELLVRSESVWWEAKEKSDFAMFCPFLKQVFETSLRFAGYTDPDKKPYEALLDEYEEGLSTEVCDRFFAGVRERIVPLIRRIGEAEQIDDSCLDGSYPDWQQERFAKFLMETIGLDLDHVGLGTTEHPFTTSLGSHLDERITTHFHPDRMESSMFSVIHEGGHALYDTGSAPELAFTVLDGGVSMAVHESQSRFYENILGRSPEFLSFIFPKLAGFFPGQLSGVTEEQFCRAVNRVQPSLIRTEADEVTYCLHVLIRYELEQAVLNGEVKVEDLPGEWNALYRKYLGVEVPDDRRGVLQDSHWSGGLIGYFPSYALGSAYGAQFLRKMEESVPVFEDLKDGRFMRINDWNREHIWKYGCLKKPAELTESVFGGPFDPEWYFSYLEEKFKKIYRI